MKWIRRRLTSLGVLTARPAVFLIFACYVICWAVFSRDTLDWAAVATLATWGMTLVIQRAEHRDTQAIHAKLDELLRIHGDANNELMQVDEEDAEEIEKRRRRTVKGSVHPSVEAPRKPMTDLLYEPPPLQLNRSIAE